MPSEDRCDVLFLNFTGARTNNKVKHKNVGSLSTITVRLDGTYPNGVFNIDWYIYLNIEMKMKKTYCDWVGFDK